MFKIFGIVTLIFLFSGCVQNQSTPPKIKQTALYGNAIQFTKSVKIQNGKEVRAIFNVTYLDPIHKVFNENGMDQFIVGVYIVEPYKNIYEISINGIIPENIKDFTPAHPMYGRLPSFNQWATYKVISIPSNEDLKNITVSLDHIILGTAKAVFQAY